MNSTGNTFTDSVRVSGGFVRDAMLDRPSKDLDFAVNATDFAAMRAMLDDEGFEVFTESPEFGTVRARFPMGAMVPTWVRAMVGDRLPTADFALCRVDGFSSDSRRPDSVTVVNGPEAFTMDAQRRDFTVGALFATWSDPMDVGDTVGGMADLASRTLRFVGDPAERLAEDGLRALRALRFCCTLDGFTMDPDTAAAVNSPAVAELLAGCSVERRREELVKAFTADTLRALELVQGLPTVTREALFSGGLRLDATLKG